MRDYLRLLKFLRPHIWVFAIAILFMLLFGIFEKASLWSAIPLVDNILSGKEILISDQQHVPPFLIAFVNKINILGKESPLVLFYWIAGILGVLLVLREITSYFKNYFMRDIG